MKRTQKATAGFAAVAICLAVFAGCSSSHHSANAGTTTTTVSPTSTTAGGSTTTTTAAGSSSGTTTPATSGTPQCPTSQLTGSLGGANGAAGTIYYQIELRNTGSSACVVQGYPGVSFVAGSNGHQVGAPAQRMQASAPTVTLSPGQTAYALLGIVDAGNFGSSCQMTAVLGLRVYPPGQTASLYIAHQDQGCANSSIPTLTIDPFNSSPTT